MCMCKNAIQNSWDNSQKEELWKVPKWSRWKSHFLGEKIGFFIVKIMKRNPAPSPSRKRWSQTRRCSQGTPSSSDCIRNQQLWQPVFHQFWVRHRKGPWGAGRWQIGDRSEMCIATDQLGCLRGGKWCRGKEAALPYMVLICPQREPRAQPRPPQRAQRMRAGRKLKEEQPDHPFCLLITKGSDVWKEMIYVGRLKQRSEATRWQRALLSVGKGA